MLPLLRGRFEIARLVLVQPDILLEVDAQGHPNWQFARPGKSPSTAGGPSAGGSPSPSGSVSTGGGTSTKISFHDVQIEDGTLAMRDDRTGKTHTLALKRLTANPPSPDAPLTLAANATYNGVAFKLGGEVGPLARLQQPDSDTPWPVKLTLAAAGATVSVDGALTRPLEGRGYTLTLDGSIPDLTAMAPLLPGIRLPPLHDVHLATQFADSGGKVPHVEAATLHLGAADLDSYVRRPAHRVGGYRRAGSRTNRCGSTRRRAWPTPRCRSPRRSAARRTPPSLTQTAAPGRCRVDLTLQAANASLTVKGTVAHPETLSGADLALDATIPDLSALSALAHRQLPAVTQIAFQGRLTDAPGGFRHGATLRDVRLTTADGDLSGTIGVEDGPPAADRQAARRPHRRRRPAGRRRQTGDQSRHPPTGTARHRLRSTGSVPPVATMGSTAASGPGIAPPPSASRGGRRPRRLFPGYPDPVRPAAAGERRPALSVDDLKTGGSDYRAINAAPRALGRQADPRAALRRPAGRPADWRNERGRRRPCATIVPAQSVAPARSVASAPSIAPARSIAPAPSIALTLHAPGLEVAPLLAAAGLPGYAAGRMEVYADLHGAGDTPHAIAAGLDGSLGLAMQNGTIDTQLLERLLGPMLQRANLLRLAVASRLQRPALLRAARRPAAGRRRAACARPAIRRC